MKDRKHIEEKVFSFIKTHHMFLTGEKVIVGVSGGADSVCLLFMLLEWAKQSPLTIAVAHINHGIRQDAGKDAAYVEALCSKLGIDFYLKEADVAARAKREKRSEEEAGRLTRYEFFQQTAAEYGAEKIAVAHNANDRAETVLFHLLRGSGLSGLCGIRPVRGQIVRPILCLERWEIEQYLKEREISYCMDSTNEGDDYTRNRIRHHILPYAQKEIVKGCIRHISRTGEMLGETEEYLEQQTQKARQRCVQQESEKVFIIKTEEFRMLHTVLQKRLLYTLVKELTPEKKDITYMHIQDVLSLFLQEENRTICLPYKIQAYRQYKEVFLKKEISKDGLLKEEVSKDELLKQRVLQEGFLKEGALKEEVLMQGFSKEGLLEEKELKEPLEYIINLEEIPPQGIEILTEGGEEFYFQVLKKEKNQDIPKNQYTKWLDYDKMEKSLRIRKRKSGDYFTIRGSANEVKHKLVKDYMITEKIPRMQRDQIWVLAQKQHILWMVGWRISEHFKISEETKRILQVQFRKECAKDTDGTEEKMAEHIKVMLSEKQVIARIQAMAEQISKEYEGKQVHLICVLKGGSFFMCELAKHITVPVTLDFMSISSYGSETKSSGVVKIIKDLDEPIQGKDVLVVEDIVDSGRTLKYLMELLQDRKPNSLRLCTLLDKPDRRIVNVHVDYTGFEIPDEFVVGYGLDYNQKYRNLPYIGMVEFS